MWPVKHARGDRARGGSEQPGTRGGGGPRQDRGADSWGQGCAGPPAPRARPLLCVNWSHHTGRFLGNPSLRQASLSVCQPELVKS